MSQMFKDQLLLMSNDDLFFFFPIRYLLVLHKQIQIKYSSFNQVPTHFCRLRFSSALQFLIKSPMTVLSCNSHAVGTRSFACRLMFRRLRSIIRLESKVGTACRDHRLCDGLARSLWPSFYVVVGRDCPSCIGCRQLRLFHERYPFIAWSPFGVFSSWAKSRSGDTP
jgi:hypothetical protein